MIIVEIDGYQSFQFSMSLSFRAALPISWSMSCFRFSRNQAGRYKVHNSAVAVTLSGTGKSVTIVDCHYFPTMYLGIAKTITVSDCHCNRNKPYYAVCTVLRVNTLRRCQRGKPITRPVLIWSSGHKMKEPRALTQTQVTAQPGKLITFTKWASAMRVNFENEFSNSTEWTTVSGARMATALPDEKTPCVQEPVPLWEIWYKKIGPHFQTSVGRNFSLTHTTIPRSHVANASKLWLILVKIVITVVLIYST